VAGSVEAVAANRWGRDNGWQMIGSVQPGPWKNRRILMNFRQISNNLMLTIDQISQLTGVPKSTLRYWEKSFNLCLKPSRTPSNRREYTLEDLECIKTIKLLLDQEHLTSQGLRLMEIYPRRGEVELGRQAMIGEVSAGAAP
jgi:hypothetical protein